MRIIKAFTLALLSALILPNLASAQDSEFGIKGGPNFHNNYGYDRFDPSMRVGFHLGGFAQFGIGDDLFLRSELLYSLEGNRFQFEFGGQSSTVTNSLNYLAIPVMARYSLDGLYFEGGPSIGFFLGQRTRSEDDVSDLDSDGYNTMEFALELGGGYKLESGLDLGLRLDLGLTGINDLDDDAPDDVDRIKNIGLRLSGAYSF